MASLHFSNYLAYNMLRFTMHNEAYSSIAGHSALSYRTGSGNEGYFRIFKGTVPTDFSFATSSTSYTRTSDKLIEWVALSSSSDLANISIVTNGQPFTLNLSAKTAIASGTATWFWWCSITLATTLSLQMVGTVGTTGSGADIEIPVVDIVSGQSYRLTNVRWGVPSAYSY